MMMKKNRKFPNPHPDDPQYAFNRATSYLSLRARSEKEVENFLIKKDFNPNIIPAVIKRLRDLNFLNDEEYARSFTRTRQEYKGKSKYFIKYELKQKGIEKKVIDEIGTKNINGLIHCSGGAQTKVLHYIDNLHIIKMHVAFHIL